MVILTIGRASVAARMQIKEARAEGWICLTATGLQIMGKIRHELFRDGPADWELVAQKLAKIVGGVLE